ncbi:hypothetical protein Pelo_7365 [Pelomyxa schiedti]|nr:hypothetical protein Pelo_7365 [Pelomyxa schiedti]
MRAGQLKAPSQVYLEQVSHPTQDRSSSDCPPELYRPVKNWEEQYVVAALRQREDERENNAQNTTPAPPVTKDVPSGHTASQQEMLTVQTRNSPQNSPSAEAGKPPTPPTPAPPPVSSESPRQQEETPRSSPEEDTEDGAARQTPTQNRKRRQKKSTSQGDGSPPNGADLHRQMVKYGAKMFERDSEGRYRCFFEHCSLTMTNNFSRHIHGHEQRGDAIKPHLRNCINPSSRELCFIDQTHGAWERKLSLSHTMHNLPPPQPKKKNTTITITTSNTTSVTIDSPCPPVTVTTTTTTSHHPTLPSPTTRQHNREPTHKRSRTPSTELLSHSPPNPPSQLQQPPQHSTQAFPSPPTPENNSTIPHQQSLDADLQDLLQQCRSQDSNTTITLTPALKLALGKFAEDMKQQQQQQTPTHNSTH